MSRKVISLANQRIKKAEQEPSLSNLVSDITDLKRDVQETKYLLRKLLRLMAKEKKEKGK
jgi:hypothetical protein